jgi:hypothetical protein
MIPANSARVLVECVCMSVSGSTGVPGPRSSAFSLTIHNLRVDESQPTARFLVSFAADYGLFKNRVVLTGFHDIARAIDEQC